MTARTHDDRRSDIGRDATKPSDIPAKGWKQVLLRVKSQVSGDNLSIIAAGMAFYAILAIFPLLIAMVSIYGLVADPQAVRDQIESIKGLMPAGAQSVIFDQLNSIVTSSTAGLSISVVISILAALWSASSGTSTLMQAINICYDEKETRGTIRLRLTALALTAGAILFVLVAIALIAVVPQVLGMLGLSDFAETAINAARWPVLALGIMAGLGVLSRFAPNREKPKWRWITWGAALTAILWLGASFLFSAYVNNFGSYNKTYGSLAGVIVLLLWLYVSSFVILLGAELNAELEHQTAVDTTTGKPKPMGERDAVKADTLPPDNETGETKNESRLGHDERSDDVDLRSGA